MKLYYRGTSYEYDPSQIRNSNTGQPKQVRGAGSAYNLIYRGHTYHVDPNAEPAEVPTLRATYKLIYRGTTYLVNRMAQGDVTVVTQPTRTPYAKIKAAM